MTDLHLTTSLLITCFLFSTSCMSSPKYPASDHFNGSRFFNPTYPQGQSLGEILKFFLNSDPKPWPKEVSNTPLLTLNESISDDEALITFVNHATVLIQLNGFNILTDPIWSQRASPVGFAGPKRVREPGIKIEDLPKIDLVVVSHNHFDHMDLDTLSELNKRFTPRFIVPLGDKRRIEKLGAKDVVELDWWQSNELGKSLEVIFTPTQHFSGRSPFTFNKSLWGGYVIKHKGRKIYFGGDAGYSSHFLEIARRMGPMDLSFIPIGAYEPRWFMKPVHMNPQEAVQAHIDLQSRTSIGIHFGTFQLTEESMDQPLLDLNAAKKEKGLRGDEFSTLGEGQTKKFHFRISL